MDSNFRLHTEVPTIDESDRSTGEFSAVKMFLNPTHIKI